MGYVTVFFFFVVIDGADVYWEIQDMCSCHDSVQNNAKMRLKNSEVYAMFSFSNEKCMICDAKWRNC